METKPKIKVDLKKVELLASRGLSQAQIALQLGISESTLYNRKRETKEFAEAIKNGRNRGIAYIANKLYEKASAGDNACMMFFLKTQGGWSEKSKVELTGEDGQPVKIQNVFINDLKD
jgi:transcriptional regulator with XRE-family HTH domain